MKRLIKLVLISCWVLISFTLAYAQNSSSKYPNGLANFSAEAKIIFLKYAVIPNSVSQSTTDGSITTPNLNQPCIVLSGIICIKESVDQSSLESQLVQNNIKINSKIGNIWTTHIPNSALWNLASIEGIQTVDFEQEPVPYLNIARADVNADLVQKGELGVAYKGKNVIMGVIDGGFDSNHPNLRFQDGRSRIVRWWNFLDTTGTPPKGFNYASEYKDNDKILEKVTDAVEDYHGAHVASIAGGSGDATTGEQYWGLAPESDLVLVSIPYGSNQSKYKSSVADGLKYIFDYAQSVGKPCVINNSFGYFFGPHDGTDPLSQACDNLVGKGKIIVASAGNNGDTDSHIEHNFDTDTLLLIAKPVEYNRDSISFITGADIWGSGDEKFEAGIGFYQLSIGEFATPLRYYPADTDPIIYNPKLPDSSKITVEISGSNTSANKNGKYNMTFKVKYFSKSLDYYPFIWIRAKKSKMHIWNPYNYYGASFINKFKNTTWVDATKGTPTSNMSATHCNSTSVIAVASHTIIDAFENESGQLINLRDKVGDIAGYSSRGPTADGRIKPDISAPGNWVVAGGSSATTDDLTYNTIKHVDFLNKKYPYIILTGTSMAGPVTAGSIALMLEANPNLTPSTTLEILKKTARIDEFTGEISTTGSNTWGWGKLNTLDAVREAKTTNREYYNQSVAGVLVPNPIGNNNSFHILLDKDTDYNGKIEVVDLTGRTIIHMANINEETQINVQNIPNSIYIVNYTSPDGRKFNQKLILNKQ